jgi:hypothetical protein
MGWYSGEADDLEEEMRQAATHYLKKYGQPAQEAMIHPARYEQMMEKVDKKERDKGLVVCGIPVRASSSVMLKDIWIR